MQLNIEIKQILKNNPKKIASFLWRAPTHHSFNFDL